MNFDYSKKRKDKVAHLFVNCELRKVVNFYIFIRFQLFVIQFFLIN